MVLKEAVWSSKEQLVTNFKTIIKTRPELSNELREKTENQHLYLDVTPGHSGPYPESELSILQLLL